MAAGKEVPKYWDPKHVYDLSAEERSHIEQRAKMRAELREEFLRKSTDPMRAATYPSLLFDPGTQRYLSMRACQHEYFRATPKSALIGLAFAIPTAAFVYYISYQHAAEETKRRNGEVAYKDRQYKYMAGTT